MDHIFALNHLLGRVRKCKSPIRVLFVDYEVPLVLSELNAVHQALVNEGIDGYIVEVVKGANKICSTNITLSISPVRILIEKDVRPLLPKLFTSCLDGVPQLNCKDGDINYASRTTLSSRTVLVKQRRAARAQCMKKGIGLKLKIAKKTSVMSKTKL